jgi:dihydrofolate reductase
VTRVSIIVATDDRGGIGRDGQLPWRLPDDLQRFKRITMGKPVVMGRRTWESIGRPLPGRRNIVISGRPGFAAPGATVAGSLDEALRAAGDVPEVCVIGGAEIYRLALPLAQEIHLTRVHALVDADAFFPALDPAEWEEIGRDDHAADERHAYPYSFVRLVRVRPA